jgi:type VI secretion system protein ImpL
VPFALLQQLLRSRLALLLTIGGVVGLFAAAVVRLIPWGLFVLTLLLAVVGALAASFIQQWWAQRKDASLEQGLDAQGQRAVGHARVRDRESVKTLQTQWKQQVEALRKSRIGKQRRWLYFLPWYVIIGAPASGKSTAIKNSGLRFPMGEPKLSGTGGTRNCDWWFAEEAIILDTAGRYTFNEENEPDRDEWLEFLRLLRKYRPVAPINGLIVALSADTLLSQEPDQLVEDARTIRHKLDQLVRELGIQFPVYLLITKCDLIEGFTEFFGRLPRRRLDEILGWTNPSWEMSDARALVAGAVGDLRGRVAAMRPGFLWEEERPEPLRAIYLFPEELRAFERALEDFSDVLFRENQYNESPFLRGIYLTSGLQKGTAVSRMLDRLGLRAQATELREEKRSYFLKDVFQIRLPADKNLVATTGKARGRLQVFHNLGLAIVAAACVLAAVVTGGSYVANRTLLNDLEDEMRAAASSAEQAPAERVQALARYVDVVERLEDRNRRRPLSARWGLWTGERAIEPARRLFLSRFERDAYAPGVDTARKLLRARDPEQGFAALEALVRNYVLSKLLVGTDAEAPGANDALAVFWANGKETNEDLLRAYARGYLAYLRWRPVETARAEQANDLVIIREALPEMFTVERVAAWADRLYPAFRAQDIPVPAAIANGAMVRGAFRPEAWGERVGPLVDAVDEIAPEIDPGLVPRFRGEFGARYLGDWLTFLMRPRAEAGADVPVATVLGEQTPYLAIVERTAAACAANPGGGEPPAWTKTTARVAAERGPYLAQLAAIDRHLKAGRSDPPAALEDAKSIFARRVAVAAEEGAEPPPDPFGKTERFVDTLVAKEKPVDADDGRVHARLQELLAAPVYDAFRAYMALVGDEVDLQWSRRIAGMPSRSPADLQALYAQPNGAVWVFNREVLGPFFESPGYQAKVRYRGRLPRSLDFLRGVESTTGALFGPDGRPRQHKLFFTSVPSAPGEGGLLATRTALTVWCGDGEPWQLEHRQFRKSQQLTWSFETCGRAEVAVSVGSGPGDERPLDPIGAEGPMGLPTLLGEAERQGNQFSWRFPGGVTATFEVNLPPRFLEARGGGAPPSRLPRP